MFEVMQQKKKYRYAVICIATLQMPNVVVSFNCSSIARSIPDKKQQSIADNVIGHPNPIASKNIFMSNLNFDNNLMKLYMPMYSALIPVSYTHLRAHETRHDLVCRLLLEKKKHNNTVQVRVRTAPAW
eukprot:TRINITY_DN21007_c0_g1_i1.p4 TRINITY_DN21007_c0_g1~~TRINITY_DN21007_c0_g1_i1.p4  ORF type:complete len:128 (+),score=12.51 TRINITY_DN21007_c0_g1_i1:571-954(+)